jgi:hypothetical protein
VSGEDVKWYSFCSRAETHTQTKQSEQAWGMNLVAFQCMFWSSFDILWTEPDANPNMLATSQIVILVFLRTSSCTYPDSHLFQLSLDVLRSHCFWTSKTTQKLVPLSLLFTSHFQHFQSFHVIFPQFNARCDADTVLWSLSSLITLELWQEQHTLVHNKILPNSHMCYSLIQTWNDCLHWGRSLY